jgi:hypothetical protein
MLREFRVGSGVGMAIAAAVAVAQLAAPAVAAQDAPAKREVLRGHLMPFKCQNDDKPTHTRDCAMRPECAVTGYGLALEDGTFVQFDAESNGKAVKLLAESTKSSDLIAEVEGERVGPLFRVQTIRLK